MIHYYEVNLSWETERKGKLSSPVLNESFEVATPPEFPKGMPGIWSPEHLLVASVSSCFMTTFLAIAENSKLEFESLSVSAKGKLEKIENKFMISEITLFPKLVIHNTSDMERATRILEKSDAACLISNSIKSKIILKPEVTTVAVNHVVL
ncbi:MAG: OsmC family protein [Bacteroidia bacterium]